MMADTNLLGDLLVKIKGDFADLEKALNKSESVSEKSAEKQSGYFKKQFKEIDSLLNGIPSKMIKLFTNPLVLAATAVVGMTRRLIDGTKEFVDYGSAINNAADKTGLTTDAIQKWKFIAEQSNTTLESVTTAVATMTRGLVTNADTYKALGIELKNTDGSMRSTSEIFDSTIGVLAATADETQRDQLAFQLLGRSAQSLIPILNSGTSGIAALSREANNLGLILDEKAVKNADRLGNSTKALESSMASARRVLVSDMAPALISIADGFRTMIESMLRSKAEIEALREATKGQITDLDKNSLALTKLTSENDKLQKLLASTAPNDKLRSDSLKGAIADNKKLEDQLRTQRAELILMEKQKLRDAGATERQAEAAAKKAAADADAKVAAEALERFRSKAMNAAEKDLEDAINTQKELRREEDEHADRRERAHKDYVKQVKEQSDIIGEFQTLTTTAYDSEILKINQKRDIFIAAGVSEVAAETLATQQKVELITGYSINTNLQVDIMKDIYNGLGDTFSSVFEQLGQDIANGEVSWKSLGTAAIRSIGNIVSAIGDELAAKAGAALIEAIALASNPFTALAAPGFFRSAAKYGTGAAAAYVTAGIMKATTLAQGGQVSDPTLAMVGDNPRYDEVVAPLSPEVFAGIADGIVNALASRARPAGVTPATAGSAATLTSTSGSKVVNINIGQFIGDDAGIRKFARELRPYLQQENVRVGG
jgi:hypothetical protein